MPACLPPTTLPQPLGQSPARVCRVRCPARWAAARHLRIPRASAVFGAGQRQARDAGTFESRRWPRGGGASAGAAARRRACALVCAARVRARPHARQGAGVLTGMMYRELRDGGGQERCASGGRGGGWGKGGGRRNVRRNPERPRKAGRTFAHSAVSAAVSGARRVRP